MTTKPDGEDEVKMTNEDKVAVKRYDLYDIEDLTAKDSKELKTTWVKFSDHEKALAQAIRAIQIEGEKK